MQFRKAKMRDVEDMYQLINTYANQGLMLARSRYLLYESLREFTIGEENGKVLAVAGLHIIWEDLAEVRAVAVAEEALHRGVGTQLVEELIAEARLLGIPRVFALTYQPGFFGKCGFEIISKDQLLHKVWQECIHCPKFPNCDETAMIRPVD